MDGPSEVVIPAHESPVLENLVPGGTTHWVRYAPKKWSLITSTGQYGGIPENLRRRPYLILLYPLMMTALLRKTWKLAQPGTVLHAHWLPNGVIAAIIKRFKGNPFVLTMRGADEKLFQFALLRPVVKSIFKSADAVTTVSSRLKEEIENRFQIKAKIFYIPNGVDLPDLPLRSSSGIFKLLYVGSLIPRKGLNDLIEAIDQLKDRSQLRLQIVGSGWERDRLVNSVNEKKLGDTIEFLGAISPLEVQSKMLESDSLVLPTYFEGTPNVIKEAMACGLPVITTTAGGIPELVTHKKQGLLFEPGDVDSLTRHITYCMQHRDEAAEMGKNGRRFIVEERLTWENTAQSYLSLYRDIVQN